MNDLSDSELVQLSTAGNRAAYGLLLDRHLQPIMGYTTRMLGNAGDAEDITQEVFLRLWTQGTSFNPQLARLTTWLHTIAHNLCLDFFAKSRRTQYGEDGLNLAALDNPEQQLDREQQHRDLAQALLKLPERQRSAIILCQYQGLSNIQAASILNVSVDALESLMARGRRSLKSQLENLPGHAP